MSVIFLLDEENIFVYKSLSIWRSLMRKHGKCPGCCPTGGAIFDATVDYSADTDDLSQCPPIWKCANCGHEMPRRVHKRPTEDRITPAQAKAIERLKQQIVVRHSLGHPEEHEFKKFETNFFHGVLFLVSEYGRKNDEGTMASVLCRDYRHFKLGRKGKITLLNAKDKKKYVGLFHSCNALV